MDVNDELRRTVESLAGRRESDTAKRERATRIVDQINSERRIPPPAPDLHKVEYDFDKLGVKIAESLERAAQDQLTLAQNNLEQAKAFADNLRAQLAEKNRELADMNLRLKDFGETILSAHKKFHNAEELNQARTAAMFEAHTSLTEPQPKQHYRDDRAPEADRDRDANAEPAPKLRWDPIKASRPSEEPRSAQGDENI
jgi:chromosome segregation ATPase